MDFYKPDSSEICNSKPKKFHIKFSTGLSYVIKGFSTVFGF